MALVSIIVPVYKSEKYLHYCLDSIIAQDYEDIEIILVNDGSPDNSGKICDTYAKSDSRIKVIHKENAGVSEARNTGIYSASGKYILFVDSDDCIRKNYVSEFVKAKEKYPDCKNIWCAFEVRHTYENMDLSRAEAFSNTSEYRQFTIKNMATLAEKWLTPMIWNKMFDREVIVNNLLKMDKTMSLGEDLIFGLDYIDKTENSDIVFINKPLYIYLRTGKESLDNKFYDNKIELSYKMNSALDK